MVEMAFTGRRGEIRVVAVCVRGRRESSGSSSSSSSAVIDNPLHFSDQAVDEMVEGVERRTALRRGGEGEDRPLMSECDCLFTGAAVGGVGVF